MRNRMFFMAVAVLLFSAFSATAQVLDTTGTTCAGAIEMICGSTYTGSTLGVPNDNATSGAGAVSCGSLGTAGQHWYALTPTESGLVSVSTCGSLFDTYLRVYSGSCGNLSCIAYNDDAGSQCNGIPNGNSLDSYVSFTAIAGETYLVRVGGFASQSGTYQVQSDCTPLYGCSDPLACNYAPGVQEDGSCEYDSCTGCTDAEALNYDPSASIDDGSCTYCDGIGSVNATLYVCTFSNGGQVALEILDSDGNVVIAVNGLNNGAIAYFDLCLQAGECYTVNMSNTAGLTGWYNGYFWINANGVQFINEELDNGLTEESTFFSIDGTCTPIPGCTDADASNYNAEANVDDGSCVYIEDCESGNQLLATVVTGAWANELGWSIVAEDGTAVLSGGPYNANNATYLASTCVPDGCYTLVMTDSFGDGWNGGTINVVVNGTGILIETLGYGAIEAISFGINAEGCESVIPSGCTDASADNYDPEAVTDDGSCVYTGCTDPNALNYDWTATEDDGSCEYCEGEGSIVANLYICTFSNGGQVELVITDENGNEVIAVSGLNNGAIAYFDICLQPGMCYTATMSNNAGPFGWYNGYFWINGGGVQFINESLNPGTQTESVQFSIDGTCGPVVVYGCTDPNATNFDPEATVNDGSCTYPVAGCTDPEAMNYNADATEDDGSCIYSEDCDDNWVGFQAGGGIFQNEVVYTVYAEDGSVVFSGEGAYASTSYVCLPDGCYTIDLFDTFGDGWNGNVLDVSVNGVSVGNFTLDYGNSGQAVFGVNSADCVPAIYGCTDPNALNYDPNATVDDGSCINSEDCDDNFITIVINTQAWGSEVSWMLIASDGTLAASGSGYSSWNTYTTYVCLPDGCYEMAMEDSWGDGWNGGYYMIYGNGTYSEGTLLYGGSSSDLVGVNAPCADIAGCTDPEALNYNPAASWDDGSCVYNDLDGFNYGYAPGMDIEILLFPNPTNGGMVLDATHLSALEPIVITITSMEGKMVHSLVIPNEEPARRIQLDVQHLAPGYYMMNVQNGEQHAVRSFIRE